VGLYAIGDIQGCYDELQRLLERIRFDPAADQLWFVGDLVNRGPKSLEVLRFVNGLGARAVTVLGNHDLHLLAVAAGVDALGRKDTFQAVLAAPDRDELLSWLRRQPLLHHDTRAGYTLIHAGLPPQWDLAQAQACAAEVEATLRGEQHVDFFQHMYGDEPDRWNDALIGYARLRFSINCLTRLRYVDAEGRAVLKEKGAPDAKRKHLTPWFRAVGRRSLGNKIIFGHWSTLGLVMEHNVHALDTGCVWGGALTALRLDGEVAPIGIDCPQLCAPGAD
jgi:bis(5'-nucleosyl)-tetraphosphatase (symmetrical)